MVMVWHGIRGYSVSRYNPVTLHQIKLGTNSGTRLWMLL